MKQTIRQLVEDLLKETRESIKHKEGEIDIAKQTNQFEDAMKADIKLKLLKGYEYRLENILKP